MIYKYLQYNYEKCMAYIYRRQLILYVIINKYPSMNYDYLNYIYIYIYIYIYNIP